MSTSAAPTPSSLECQCPISYTVKHLPDGRRVAEWDQEPPSLMEMCFGRCPRCGLPYHTEFSTEEPV
jgi:hypothetical protein